MEPFPLVSEYECLFKGIVQPKMKMMSLFTYAHVIQNLCGFLSSTQQNKIFWRILVTKCVEWTKHIEITQNKVSHTGLEQHKDDQMIHFWLDCPFKLVYAHFQVFRYVRGQEVGLSGTCETASTSSHQMKVLFSWDDGGKTLFSWDGGVKIRFSSDGSVKRLC